MIGINKIIRVTCLLIFVFVLHCSKKEKNPFGYEDIAGGKLGDVNHYVSYGTIAEKSFAFPEMDLGTSNDILIGSYNDEESAALLKFGTIADHYDSVIVQKAYLYITPRYKIPGDSLPPMEVSLHLVSIDWDEETVDPATILNNYDLNPISSGVPGCHG